MDSFGWEKRRDRIFPEENVGQRREARKPGSASCVGRTASRLLFGKRDFVVGNVRSGDVPSTAIAARLWRRRNPWVETSMESFSDGAEVTAGALINLRLISLHFATWFPGRLVLERQFMNSQGDRLGRRQDLRAPKHCKTASGNRVWETSHTVRPLSSLAIIYGRKLASGFSGPYMGGDSSATASAVSARGTRPEQHY